MIRRKIVTRPGAQRRGGLLHLPVELEQHRLHGAHHERQRDEQQGDHDADPGVGDVDADRALGPVQRSSTRPATIVGSANGRSISVSTTRLPGNSSRTSTHAISVPITSVDERDDDRRDDRQLERGPASGVVTASQNAPSPSSCRAPHHRRERDEHDHAQVEHRRCRRPSWSGPPRRRRAAAGPAGGDGARPGRVSHAAQHSCSTETPSVRSMSAMMLALRVEELRHDLVPAAEVVDGEQARSARELSAASTPVDHRPVAVVGEDLLRLRGDRKSRNAWASVRVLGVRGDRDRVLDQDRLRRARRSRASCPFCWAKIASFS